VTLSLAVFEAAIWVNQCIW